jgi:hypothetical protein
VADYNPNDKYHRTTERSVAHAAEKLEIANESVSLDTMQLEHSWV